MRARVTLQEKLSVPDGGGGADEGWSDVVTLWAELRSGPGREIVSAEGVSTRNTLTVIVRTRSEIAPDWRLMWKGRVYAIAAVLPDLPRPGFSTLDCLEGAPS